ncbi:HNH endonuclease signature motif containing protein [Natronobacterium texcoconense]|uniref:Putative restriction endonuclease n=1 Tax=Natronobacterium texcoconense TaxID=1095778 RepID=A0A1H1FZS7_NATTX|nr:HNH endonuclease signature motif containing protein [Natronobacterium texcoconense]SDR06309.1 putative restriction endonuclease [Natronobacterium texcoconense]
MPPERLRSIVPMFGGATSYVGTLEAIIEYVDEQHPTTDELVGWHRGSFARVSSQDSIMRRVEYLEDVGFLATSDDRWVLGPEGERYAADPTTETLLELMCRRNVGLRSLLYALSVGPMTIEEIGCQQLETHPELGWNPENPDMALQRVNWLRSLGLVEKDGEQYVLSDEGRQFTDTAVEAWADSEVEITSTTANPMTAGTYETAVEARAIDPEFRATALARFDRTCPISGVDHPGLLDVAHVLSWSDYPEYRADLSNVLPLSKTHHAAFDRELFTIDQDYRLRVNPDFDTESDLLQRTIVDQAGEQLPLPDGSVDTDYVVKHNAALEWV